MFRRLVSAGPKASENDDEPMSPSPGDGNSPAPEPSNKAAGALASVFKGLTGSKQPKPYPATLAPTRASSATSADYLPGSTSESDLAPPQKAIGAGILAPSQAANLEQLKNGKLNERIAAADALRYCIADYPFNPVLEIWYAGKDLIEQDKPTNVRVAGWGLLKECAKHAGSTDLERKEYFDTLTAPASAEDFHLQLEALIDLTKRGRDLSGFDYDMFPLMTRWLNESFKAVIKARKQRTAKNTKGKSSPIGEDTNFSQLFLFLLDVIKFSFKVADDRTIAILIKSLREICINANVEEDLIFCINAITAIVTFGKIPSKSLPDALNVLSAIFALVPNLKKEAWHALANLYKSHHGEEAVQVLLRVVRQFPPEGRDPKESSREVRGALAALGKLVTKTTAKGYPQVPLGQLVDGLANASSKSASPRLLGAVLEVVNCLLDVGDRQLNSMIVDEDWSPILNIAATCTGKLLDLQAQNGGLQRHASTAGFGEDGPGKRDKDPHSELRILSARIEHLLGEKRPEFRPDLAQRQACIAFFVKNHRSLSDAAVDLVVDHFRDFGGCSPSEPLWEQNLDLVLSFYTDSHRSCYVRLHALQLLERIFVVLEITQDILGGDHVSTLIERMLNGMAEETDTLLLQDTVTFMVSVAVSSTNNDLFELVVGSMKRVIANGRSRKNPVSDLIQPPAPGSKGTHAYLGNQSPSNVVTRGYVQIFMRTMHTNAPKASKAFTTLVHIARSNQCETDARLTAMKLLFRLRADWFGHIYITPYTESEGLAGVLYRTEASLARKLAEDAAQPSRPNRAEQGLTSRPARGASFGPGQPHERSFAARMAGGSSSAASPAVKYQQLWSLPDADALPEAPVPSSSKLLFSSEPRGCTLANGEEANEEDDTKAADNKKADGCSDQTIILHMGSWLDTIAGLFSSGSDWEVYSFVLVHLPDQLSNHALFRGARSQIQDIRKLLCDQIKSNDFREPPSSAGPRRPEVLSCLYQTLTMMLSYHHHFQKPDEDDLVRTFIHGITDKTAIICIHAITICCHEVPMSISKSLVTILQGMSRVITRQGVAMHILEFLAGLSHLTDLYSNFRDDEYRIVFGICFRYLQTVRDNNRRNSKNAATGTEALPLLPVPSPVDGASAYTNATDELPEYVFALAYHVILFWFLALKVPDRASHVGWIASRLFTDNDGKQISDEQSQVTFDFIQRVTFAAADESIADPIFKEMNPADIAEKTWLVGDSIVTVQQVITSGLAQVIKRQASGTSYFTIQQNFAPRPAHQVYNRSDATDGLVTLPSHVLVRLLSSTPQAWDSVHRPIPLADGEALERTIRTFDRNSPVDGHKVGVVYIGENQTNEVEILANVSGSEDYNKFLAGLGTMVILKGANFNTQGLDREYNTDGEHAVCWRDRVAEIVFHVTTQMPTNLERDPQCIGKKRHIGNDFVNIIFNDSGSPFKFDTFPSEFNYVNIVITPESRVSFVDTHVDVPLAPSAGADSPSNEAKHPLPCFYKVQVMTKPGFPEISPAAETKNVSLEALPHFVRLLALNASVFCLVWAGRERGQVHISPWRNRLREINRLRERFGPKLPPTSPSSSGGAGSIGTITGQQSQTGQTSQQAQQQGPPALQIQHASDTSVAASSRPASSVRDSFSSLRRSSVATFFTTTSEQTSHRSSVLSNATTDQTETVPPSAGMDSVVDSLDFSKWA